LQQYFEDKFRAMEQAMSHDAMLQQQMARSNPAFISPLQKWSGCASTVEPWLWGSLDMGHYFVDDFRRCVPRELHVSSVNVTTRVVYAEAIVTGLNATIHGKP